MLEIVFFSALLFETFPAQAATQVAECATTAPALKKLLNEDMKEKWIETTANDGKPLKIEISSKDDALYFVYDKTKEGIWAEGKAEVCKEKSGLVLRVSGSDIKLGKSAPWPVRMSMKSGAKFKLKFNGSDKLHVSTFGWSGDFIPQGEAEKASDSAADKKK